MSQGAEIPKALRFLLEPSRYKIAYGGRGGAKSWAYARVLITMATIKPMRILCARELQNSIKESVHQLLSDQIKSMGVESRFIVNATEIKGKNGSRFSFEGLRYNTDRIKSYEGTDICWVEEANKVSKSSWEILIPTIRKADSEIWISFNPELETDETYKRFVKDPPPSSIVRKINWRDNPWFPDVLKQEMETLRARDEDAYLNIWEGNPRVTLDGAIYANELREAVNDGRITRVPYDERVPVHTFWDLGFSDCTSIWFVQKQGFEYHVIDFYQHRLQKLPHYLQVLQSRGYVYGTDYLPHDAEYESVAAPSVKRQMESAGRKVSVVKRVEKVQLGINATRAIFNRLIFDEKKCDEGLQNLRHYRYDVDEHGQWSRDPKHDEHSHAADALRTLGESIGLVDKRPLRNIEIVGQSHASGEPSWMQ